MESSTTIRKMIAGNKIIVPTYQRAYSWETPKENSSRKTQTDVFLSDLEDYKKSKAQTPYYFGHFLFENKDNKFFVIDGQQRLTTIVIFLSALYKKLKSLRELTEEEKECYEDMIKRNSTIRFSTVDYDDQVFKDYVINQTKQDKNGLETESIKRIVDAFDFFHKKISTKDDIYITQMIEIVRESSCTTHIVKNESEAIQMFIFQNDRGKKPSNLEVIKAQFMFNVHLYGGAEKHELIEEIKKRFEKIYKSISAVEYKLDEDDILVYTQRVYFNSLWEDNAIEKINKQLSEANPIPFIQSFTQALAESFEHLSTFFGKDEQAVFSIHSLISLGRIGIACPFIIKAYKFGISKEEIGQLCKSLESLVLRHRLIGTKADMNSRINNVYAAFTQENPSIWEITGRIEYLKTAGNQNDWWWGHWNNSRLEESIQGKVNHSVAKFLLWKYENYLESEGKQGYKFTRYTDIESPELEHIAPTTESTEKKHGYGEYDEAFRNEYLDCLGNYLLISKSHNCSVGNVPFAMKHKSYKHLEQQREIQQLVQENGTWGKRMIGERKKRVIKFIMEAF